MKILEYRWLTLCRKKGLQGPAGWRVLAKGYRSHDRAYHNFHHIRDCLALLDAYRDFCENPVAVELAIWFHDAVYDPARTDNEERSARLAEEYLAKDSSREEVARLIRVTDHCSPAETADEQLIADIDLATLGETEKEYDGYAAAIRKEYAKVPDEGYRVGRMRVLKAFLERKSIYHTEVFQDMFEAAARANLRGEIRDLGG